MLQNLQGQVSTEVEGAARTRAAQLDAREKLLQEMEQRSRESLKRSEDESVRLQVMLQALESTVKEQREQVVCLGTLCICTYQYWQVLLPSCYWYPRFVRW